DSLVGKQFARARARGRSAHDQNARPDALREEQLAKFTIVPPRGYIQADSRKQISRRPLGTLGAAQRTRAFVIADTKRAGGFIDEDRNARDHGIMIPGTLA